MTYSEVREMYSWDAAEIRERRERSMEAKKNIFSLLFLWLTPWCLNSLLLILRLNLLNAKGAIIALIILLTSFLSERLLKEEDSSLRFLSHSFSYLVTLSFLVTAVLR